MGLLVGLAIAVHAQSPDRVLTKQIRRPALVANPGLQRTAKAVSFIGGSAPFLAAAGLVVTGHHESGRVTSQAVAASWLTTGAIKLLVGRARPYVSADTNAGDFAWWRGFRDSDYRSLPSGHATVAFAFAAAMSGHLDRTRAGGAGAAKPALYAGASLVALTRVYLDKHWPSDVLLGSAIGFLAGSVAARESR